MAENEKQAPSQEELAKKIAELEAALKAEKAAKLEAEGQLEKVTELEAALEAEKAAKLEAEEKLEKVQSQTDNIRNINGGKSYKAIVQEKNVKYEVEYVFRVHRFIIKGFGEVSAAEMLANPDAYGPHMKALIDMNSGVIEEVSRKKVK